jgi:polyisoprenyl-phosphate glycosyltransferase
MNDDAGVHEDGQTAEPLVWLSVIVPVHNEGHAFAGFLAELNDVLAGFAPKQYEIIVVDDASTDSALNNFTPNAALRVIRLSSRGGSGAARKRGVAMAQGRVIAWIDGDGTYDPKSLPTLFTRLENADQVIGARCTDHGSFKWLRLMVKRTSFLFASLLWLRWIPDLNSGLRVFHRECMLKWVHQLPDGFSCTSTATLAALSNHQRVEFVSIPYRSRTNGAASKFHPFFDTLKLWRAILKARARGSVVLNEMNELQKSNFTKISRDV